MKNTITTLITSPPDRGRLVLELWWGSEQWGEINQESGSLAIELYPRRSGRPWRFPLEQFVKAIQAAGPHLLGEPGRPDPE